MGRLGGAMGRIGGAERGAAAAAVATGGASVKSSAALVANATDLVVSGLVGETDGEYYIAGRLLVPTAQAQIVTILPNGLTTNLLGTRTDNGGAYSDTTAIQLANYGASFTGVPLEVAFEARMYARKTLNGHAVNRTIWGRTELSGTLSTHEVYPILWWGQWTEQATGLTSLTFRASVASGLLAGSEVIVWTPTRAFGA